MTLLVIGGSGLLGGAVVLAASEAGWPVVATHGRPLADPDRPLDPRLDGTDWRPLDLAGGEASVRALIRAIEPSAIVNCAYVQGGSDLGPVTRDAPGFLAAAATEVGAHLVQISTDVVFDGRKPPGEAYRETDSPNPVHEYGVAKLHAERLVGAHAPDAAIVRTSLLLPGRYVDDVRDALSGRRPMTFFTDELRSACRADDLARFLLWLATDPKGRTVAGVVHAAGATVVSRFDLAKALAAELGLDPAGVVGAAQPIGGPPRPANCALRTERGLPGLPLPGVGEAG